MSHLNLKFGLRSGFKLSTLALSISLSFTSPALFALEALDDDGLAETTGEGIAVLPENFSFRLNGADSANSGAGSYDTGYIRLIPVGPLTQDAVDSGAGKADVFLYGMALSQSNKQYGANRTTSDWNNRFGRNIDSWGSAINPWLLKVTTENDVPNFSAITPQDAGKGDVTYLMLETPLYNKNISALSDAEKSAYNLKLAAWADIFVRDPKVLEDLNNTGTQFDLGGAGRANRLRLQAVWDGLSINGSNLKLFQTLDGATNSKGMSTFYNNTLGIAGVLRLNSGDGEEVRTIITETKARNTGNWAMLHDGSRVDANNSGAFCGNSNAAVAPTYTGGCQYQVRKRVTEDTATTTITPWSGSVLRLSTRETGTGQDLLGTPAINGGQAPEFNNAEGLFIYNLNVNLVLGSLYQPLTVGSDGNNITLELARIPNKESIYKKIYTNYANANPATNGGYYGSTCNIYKCGNDVTLDGVTYQGSNATHSSISIGSTVYNAATNSLEAYSGEEAMGISFGALSAKTNTATKEYTEVESRYRQRRDRTWQYNCNFWGNCDNGTISDWEYKSGQPNSYSPLDAKNTPAKGTNPSAAQLPTANNRNWALSNAIWLPATNAALGYTNETSAGASPPVNPTIRASTSLGNNFGSAVIDGLLIQHMKITTKGL